jgi:hypothetical protein
MISILFVSLADLGKIRIRVPNQALCGFPKNRWMLDFAPVLAASMKSFGEIRAKSSFRISLCPSSADGIGALFAYEG